ncbi:MAG: septum formation inhibitor Maf [Gammaproteobacteria bacterium]|nr:septum formation inhibitor Maf [Gammaproteobacteria bacterium]
MKELVLSSSSPARKALLERLGLTFKIIAPDIDETQLQNESPQQLVTRLAITKAKVHHEKFPNALVIGSDQVAVIDNEIVGKPHSHENAVKMLTRASGQVITFYTGLCLFNTDTSTTQSAIEEYRVKYKTLSPETIENYLRKEKPYQCAGSIKLEGLGIALMEELCGKDPTTLVGMPIIALVGMLEKEGFQVV